MGRDCVTWRVPVVARLSQHNSPQDARDRATWTLLCDRLDRAMRDVCGSPEFDVILGRENSARALAVGVLSREQGEEPETIEARLGEVLDVLFGEA